MARSTLRYALPLAGLLLLTPTYAPATQNLETFGEYTVRSSNDDGVNLTGPGGGAYTGPGGGAYRGPGGGAYTGPGGGAYSGPGGPCYAGPGGAPYDKWNRPSPHCK